LHLSAGQAAGARGVYTERKPHRFLRGTRQRTGRAECAAGVRRRSRERAPISPSAVGFGDPHRPVPLLRRNALYARVAPRERSLQSGVKRLASGVGELLVEAGTRAAASKWSEVSRARRRRAPRGGRARERSLRSG